MALTRDDMLRELELLPVWQAKYVEPLQTKAIKATPEAEQQEVVLQLLELVVPAQVSSTEAEPVPAVETEGLMTMPASVPLNDALPKVVDNACVVCPLASLTQQVEATSVHFLLMGFSPNMPTIRSAELYAEQQGELLNNMLAAIKFKLAADNFTPFNQRQTQSSTLLLVLGEPAAQSLLVSEASIDELRGRVHVVQGVSVVVTYQPTHLLQHPKDKAKAWQDLLLAKKVWADLQSSISPSS